LEGLRGKGTKIRKVLGGDWQKNPGLGKKRVKGDSRASRPRNKKRRRRAREKGNSNLGRWRASGGSRRAFPRKGG